MTTPMPERMDRRARDARIEPSLLEAFERELTPDVARRLLELAARRAAMLRAAGVAVAADLAQRLVRDAITDTLTNLAPWKPEEQPLGLHLRGIIRRRTWAQLPAPSLAEPAGRAESAPPARTVLQQVAAGLSYDSPDDAAVRLVLEAYCNGAQTGAEVTAAAGISLEEYADARRRLDRMLAQLPEPRAVRERGAAMSSAAALAALWRAP